MRHLTKYVDISVPHDRGFVFWQDGAPKGRARTLEQFARALETLSPAALTGHLQRGDFSRWVADVFGDHPLAAGRKQIEARASSVASASVAADIRRAVRSRYEVFEP